MIEHYLDILAKTINENWDSPALTDFYLTEEGTAQDTSRGNRYTYGEMYMEMLRLGELFATLGLQKGDHIAICGANSAHWAIAYLAIAAYQGVAVTILHSQSTEDIAHQIDFSDAKALFADIEIWDELKDISLPKIEHVISLEDWQLLRGKEIVNHQSQITNHQCQFVHGNLDELAMICFTSGSTGNPKGVMIANKSIFNIVIGFARFGVYQKYRNERMLSFLPIAHIYGLLVETLLPLSVGCHLFIPDELSMRCAMQIVKCVLPKIIFMVPFVLTYFINDITKAGDVLEHLDFLVVAGASTSGSTENFLLSNNIPIATGYGLTECCSCCSCGILSKQDYYRQSTVGRVVYGMEIKISSNGEILVKGENVMLGYYKDPEATARKIDKDGWLHTGDKGHLDEEGYLYVEGRLEQDMIVLPNGENIHPEDIESKINAIPNVKESIVVSRNGKLVAIVVLTNSNLSQQDILNVVNPQLPLYSQLYDIELSEKPLERTEKQTLKRYLYTKKTNF